VSSAATKPSLTAVLLAGGESKRMGCDKATLQFEGRALWQRQLGLLRELEPAEIWLSARTVPAYASESLRIILDEPPSRGPVSGIAAALKLLETSHLLVLAVDLPRMSSEFLQALWQDVRPKCGVVPWNGDYYEPVCALYPREAAAFVAESIASNEISLQKIVRALLARKLMVCRELLPTELPLFQNLNRPEDLKAS
jgi:molybdopterin-guanine dinucleotide biosynthesis protein A